MNQKEVIKKIKGYGLKFATTREFPLLCLSVVGFSYGNLLKKEIGFCYSGLGGLGKENRWQSLFNEEEVAKGTEKYLEKNLDKLKDFVKRSKVISEISMQKIKKAEKRIDKDPYSALSDIIKSYVKYMTGLGMINCFWRYLGNEKSKGKLSPKLAEWISKERNIISSAYPDIEDIIGKCVNIIGIKDGFDGKLLRYMTLDEIRIYLNKKKISKKQIKELKKRTKGYVYLYLDKKDYVFADKKIIESVKKEFFNINMKNICEIRGHTAYPGLVKGMVYNTGSKKHINKKEKFVLITHMTLPGDTVLISKCSAIVTDEGGMLSHAAIVAREMKKPCIIGTKIATKLFKDGDYIEVDANKGIARKIR